MSEKKTEKTPKNGQTPTSPPTVPPPPPSSPPTVPPTSPPTVPPPPPTAQLVTSPPPPPATPARLIRDNLNPSEIQEAGERAVTHFLAGRAAAKKSLTEIVESGYWLACVKATLDKCGMWSNWLKANWPWSKQYADEFVRIATNWNLVEPAWMVTPDMSRADAKRIIASKTSSPTATDDTPKKPLNGRSVPKDDIKAAAKEAGIEVAKARTLVTLLGAKIKEEDSN